MPTYSTQPLQQKSALPIAEISKQHQPKSHASIVLSNKLEYHLVKTKAPPLLKDMTNGKYDLKHNIDSRQIF